MQAAGDRLGPYEVLAPLGAGGMGEVYRARDARLGRDVALKVLPAALTLDPDRLGRFEREARTASALNHPSIVTVYDIGTSDGVPWMAMELVEGRTLREALVDGPLPLKKTLGWATQIAEGLAKAHAAGVVHRDLKPENVMISSDGIVKILDFGLAKLVDRHDEQTRLQTRTDATEAGTVLGTVGYMSPEQAKGEPLDFRSDQFSLGSILYEMLTGRRAFARGSAPETMTAIIRDDPPPIADATDVAAPIRWIVERCLAKEPDERYASTKDLARDLARLRDVTTEKLSSSASVRRRSGRGRLAAMLAAFAIAAAVVAIAVVILVRRPSPQPLRYRPLTFHRGTIGMARFAPDGSTVLYSAAWQGAPVQLYSTRFDSTESTALPFPGATLLSVSSGGKLAVSLQHSDGKTSVAEVPLAGGAPRELVASDFTPLVFTRSAVDWAPGGDRFALVRNGALEFPVGTVLVPASAGGRVVEARFSPDGKQIAYIAARGLGAFSVNVVDLTGKRRMLTEGWDFALNLAWHPVSGEIWFSARRANVNRQVIALYGVSTDGVERLVANTPQLLIVQDIARDGTVLARSDDWPATTMCRPPGAQKELDLTWFDFSDIVAISNDGQDAVLAESGAAEGSRGGIYMRKTDGTSAAVRLGDGENAQDLSPDNKWVLQVFRDRLVEIPVGAGEPKTIRDEGFTYFVARWFRDGRRLLIEAVEQGHEPRVYVRDETGPPRPVTPEGTSGATVSPDGRLIVARIRKTGVPALYSIGGGEPRPLPGIASDDEVVGFDESASHLLIATNALPALVDRYELATGKRETLARIAPQDLTGVDSLRYLRMSPSGAYCYSFMRGLSRLYVVEGLR